jgi:transposase
MKKKRTYGSTDVEHLDLLAIVSLLTVGCIIAVDVAKTKFVAALAMATGEVLKIVKFAHPRQTLAFLRVVEALRDAQLAPRVVMEPTGTYGDALRYQCHMRGVGIEMMSPKHTHDFAEVLDGVPSMHDPKAAVALARLAVIKPSRAWVPDSEQKRDVRALLDRRWPLSTTHALYHGHLEAMLARHWPELGSLIDVHEQRSWMTLLQKYPGPRAVGAAGEEAAQVLRKASRGRLSSERVETIVESARTSLGMPMTKGEETKLRSIVEQIEQQTKGLDAVDRELSEMVSKDEEMSRLAVVVGPACAASMVSHVGAPSSFAGPSALEKGVGLNLKVKSSGEGEGKLHITKRGPAQVRQLLYLAALRLVQSDPIVAAWCRARKSYGGESKKRKAIVAVMRKLVRALWHVARGATFDASKLFDVRRLDLSGAADKNVAGAPAPATQPQAARRLDLSGAADKNATATPVTATQLPQAVPPLRCEGGVPQQHA